MTSVGLMSVYTSENDHMQPLLLPTADTENMLLSRFNMEKAVIMMAIIDSAGLDFNLLHDSGSHPS